MSTDTTIPLTAPAVPLDPPTSEHHTPPVPTPEQAEPSTGATSTAGRRTSKDVKAEQRKLRRVARKALELESADATAMTLVADLFGERKVAELAVAIITNTSRTTTSPLGDLLTPATDDPVELGIELSNRGRRRMAVYWKVLKMIGATTGELPASDVKAAISIAKAALSLTDTHRHHLNAAIELASRS